MDNLFIALFAAVLLFGCLGQAAILPGPTPVPTAAPTVSAQPTAITTPVPTAVATITPAPSPTPVSDYYTAMTFNDFHADCSKPAVISGALQSQSVGIGLSAVTVYEILNRNGVTITIEGYGNATKP